MLNEQFKKMIEKAGELAISEQQKLSLATKEDTSIVTNGDLAVSAFLEKELVKMFPEYEVFSEENSKNKPKGNKVIIIDPIDGTQSYSRKEDTWAILIGFLDGAVAVKGVVYQPTKKVFFYAEKDKGAYRIQGDQVTKLNSDRSGDLVAWVSPMKANEKKFLDKHNITKTETMYSASLKIVELAQGHGDIYPNFRKKCSLWDLVAPQLILEESGGKIVYEQNQGINFENPHLNTKIVALAKRLVDLVVF